MENKLLVDAIPWKSETKPNFPNHLELVALAKDRFGKLDRTFFAPFKNPIGLEVEVEGWRPQNKEVLYWETKQEGSLKDEGVELVTVPLSGINVDYALLELESIFRGFKPRWSVRTSLHVHVNITHLKIKDFIALVALYALLEDTLFSYTDPVRRGFSYCYPIRNISPHLVEITEQQKYCAFNIGKTNQFGTVEFRHMDGTTDIKRMRRWIQACVKLVHYVHKYHAINILRDIESNAVSLETWMTRVFGVTANFFQLADKQSQEDAYFWALAFIGENACAVSSE